MAPFLYEAILGDDMAANVVNVELKLTAKGVEEQRKATAEIANNLERASRAAKTVSMPTPGGQAAKASVPFSATTVTDKEYGKVRGSVGTGAAGRDFAKQAQGLGGLVALYATFAANIFAVGAAYEALNKAAATERLAKATQMMSVQVGVNLKAVSKNLIEASGHALSFQDAMQFTNIGTSAGLAGKQIENLTKIARGAASALGRDVNDSVRRIIQGTAKQEQEILDELGIFVKSKQAFDKYSKEMGIRVEDMTGTQRTQAYANEVERLGKKWEAFAEIDDPFSRFAATGKNALNDLLTSVNTFIKPVLSILSESESAIKSIILLVTVSLARKALPEAGKVLATFFTFDKSKVTKDLEDLTNKLTSTYNTIAANLKNKQAELSKLVVPKITTDSIKQAAGDVGYTKGVSTERGISTIKLANAFTEKDLSIYKSYADVEKKVTSLVKEQVQDKKTQSATLQTLIDRGIVTKDSTYQKLVLDQKGLEVSQNIYKQISAQNSALLTQVGLETQVLALTKDTSLARAAVENVATTGTTKPSKKSTSAAIDVLETEVTTANTIATEANTKAKVLNAASTELNAAGKLIESSANATSTAATVLNSEATMKNTVAAKVLQLSLTATVISMKLKQQATLSATVAEQNLTKAMASGLVATLGATLSAIASTVTALIGLAKGTSTAATAANLAKTAFTGLFAVLNMGFMAVMVLVTVWQLFGDSIKKFLGFSDEAEKKLERQKEAVDALNSSTTLSTATLAKYNAERDAGNVNDATKIARYTAEANAIQEHINQINATIEVEAKAAAAAKTAAAQKAAEATGLAYSIESAYYTQLSAIDKLSKADSDRLKVAASNFYNNEAAYKAGRISEEEYHTKKLAMLLSISEVEKNAFILRQQEISQLNLLNGTASALEGSLDAIAKRRAKKSDLPEFNSSDVANAFTEYNKLMDMSNISSDTLSGTLISLKTHIHGTGAASVYASALVAIFNESIAEANSSGVSLSEVLAKNKVQLDILMSGFLKQSDTVPKAAKRVKEYTDASTEGFRALAREIAQTARESELLDLTLKNTKTKQGADEGVRGYKTEKDSTALQNLELQKTELDYTKEMIKAALDYDKVAKSKTKSDTEKKDAFQAFLVTKDTLALKKQESEEAATYVVIQDEVKRNQYAINYAYELTKQNLESIAAATNASISIDQAKLDILRQSGIYNESELASMDARLQARTIEVSLLQQTATIEADRANKAALLGAQLAAGAVSGEAVASKSAEINQLADYQLASLATRTSAEQTLLALKTAQTAEQSKLNDQTNLMVEFTESLTGAFGELGTNIGKAGEALLKMAQDDEKYAKDRKAAQEDVDFAFGKEEETAAAKKLSDIDKKAAKDELKNISNVAGATKKMFAEKTAAYKVLNGIEKAAAAYNAVMQAKELASTIMAFGKKIALEWGLLGVKETTTAAGVVLDQVSSLSTVAKIPVDLAGAGAKMGSQSGWAAFAGIAALVAIVSSLGGGKVATPSIPGGMSAEDMQKSQGTGQSWVNGKLVDNGGGVFGDPTAKSESIQNSLDILTSTSVEGLSYSNKQIELLTKIKDGIQGVAEAAYGVQGVRAGSSFGSVESSTIKQGAIFGLFSGGSSSTSIIDSGLKFKGTLDSLSNAGNGVILRFETLQNTWSKSSLFGLKQSSGTNIYGNEANLEDTNATPADKKAAQAIRDVFSTMVELLTDSGDKLGLTLETTMTRIKSLGIDITASLRGLKGTESQEELTAVFSSILDDAYMRLAPSLKKFRHFGEGFAETVTRVTDGFDKVNLGLTSMGLSVIEYADVSLSATAEMLTAQSNAKDAMLAAKQAGVPQAKWEQVSHSGNGRGYDSMEIINKAEISAAKKLIETTTNDYTAATEVVNAAGREMTTNAYDLSEALIKASGGLQNFLDSAQLYAEIFLSETERLDIKKTGVANRLAELGTQGTETVTTKAITGYDSKAPTYNLGDRNREGRSGTLPGATDNTLWEAILTKSWNEHIARFGIGWDTLRTSASDLAAHMVRLSTTYETEAAKINSGEDSSYGIMGAKASTSATFDTNTIAAELFKTFSDGNDSIINTRKEYKSLIDAAYEGSKEVVSAEDTIGQARRQDYIDLYAHLMDPKLLQAQKDIWEAEEAGATTSSKLFDLETELLKLKGRTYEATLRERSQELEKLALEDISIINAQKAIYAQQDLNTTQALNLELLEAQGRSLDVIVISRTKELQALSVSDAALQMRIWRLQDEAALLDKKNSQELAIYNLLGNSAAALQLTREKELATMDEQLRPGQLYLYALQDEATLKSKLKTAYDKEKTAIKSTIDSIGGLITTLKNAKDALLVGDLSNKTPTEKYAEAKKQLLEASTLAVTTATTEAEIIAKNEAVSKLPTLTSTFLTASRELYASSSQYTADFNSVLDILDSTGSILTAQQTDAERQLGVLNLMETSISDIAETSYDSAYYLEKLANLAPEIARAKYNAAASGYGSAGGISTAPTTTTLPKAIVSNGVITGNLGWKGTFEQARTEVTDYLANENNPPRMLLDKLIAQGVGSTLAAQFMNLPIEQVKAWAANLGVPGFARGGYASGLAMVGEEGPELVDFKNPGRVYTAGQTSEMLNPSSMGSGLGYVVKEMVTEIQQLRKEVAKLRQDQQKQTGDIIISNYDANQKASDNVTNAVTNTSTNIAWAARSASAIH